MIYFPCVYYELKDGEITGRCKYYSKDGVISWCTEDFDCEHQTPSRADVIRGMSDEELAVAIAEKTYTGACNDFDIPHNGKCCGNCEKCDAIINWLKEPVN